MYTLELTHDELRALHLMVNYRITPTHSGVTTLKDKVATKMHEATLERSPQLDGKKRRASNADVVPRALLTSAG